MVYKVSPEIALHMLKQIDGVKPQMDNIHLIPDLFTKFCAHKGIDGINSITHTKTEYVYLRHVFMAVIIKLYNPELLSSIHQFKTKRQLCIQIAKVLKAHRSWVSHNINTVVVRLKVYDDFENDVLETIKVITK